MKKLLGTTLALAMFVPAGANAELLKNLKIGGQLDIQTTAARNVTDFVTRPNALSGGSGPGAAATNNDRIGHATTRVILKLDWDLLDDVHSRVTLVKGGTTATTRAYGAGAQSVQGIQDTTLVQEASVKIDKLMGFLDVTAGRQFYGEEGDLIVYYGPRDAYGLRVDSLDTFRADWNSEKITVTGIAGKTADTTVAGIGNASTDLRGVALACKLESFKPSVYIYNSVTHATGGSGAAVPNNQGVALGKNTNLWVLGAKAKLTVVGLTSSLEFAKNYGDDRATFANGGLGPQSGKFKGYAIQAKVGYKIDLSDVGMLNPWAEYGLGTGDSNFAHAGNNTFQSINTDYRPGGIYGRFDTGSVIALGQGVGTAAGVANSGGASNGLSNRIIWGFGFKAGMKKMTVGTAFYSYAFHRVAPGTGGGKTSRNIGTEFDLTGEWKHSENVSLKATAGTFQPGSYIYNLKGADAAVNPAVMLAGDVSIKF